MSTDSTKQPDGIEPLLRRARASLRDCLSSLEEARRLDPVNLGVIRLMAALELIEEGGFGLLEIPAEDASVSAPDPGPSPAPPSAEETVAEETVRDETAAHERDVKAAAPEETVAEETVAEETVAEETVANETVPDDTVAYEAGAPRTAVAEAPIEPPAAQSPPPAAPPRVEPEPRPEPPAAPPRPPAPVPPPVTAPTAATSAVSRPTPAAASPSPEPATPAPVAPRIPAVDESAALPVVASRPKAAVPIDRDMDPFLHDALRDGSFPELEHYSVVELQDFDDKASRLLMRREPGGEPAELRLLGLMDPTSQRFRRFVREGEIQGSLNHPGIPALLRTGVFNTPDGPRPYHLSEIAEGTPLFQHIRESGVHFRGRLKIIAEVCDVLSYIHQKGLIHRRLKPGNILVDSAGRIRILDFGIAKVADEEGGMTAVGQIMGNVNYMSPEQVLGQSNLLDARADVYAIGGIGYTLLSGRAPLDFTNKRLPQILAMINSEEAPPLSRFNSGYQGTVEAIFAKALAKDPERRFVGAAEMARAIREFLHSGTTDLVIEFLSPPSIPMPDPEATAPAETAAGDAPPPQRETAPAPRDVSPPPRDVSDEETVKDLGIAEKAKADAEERRERERQAQDRGMQRFEFGPSRVREAHGLAGGTKGGAAPAGAGTPFNSGRRTPAGAEAPGRRREAPDPEQTESSFFPKSRPSGGPGGGSGGSADLRQLRTMNDFQIERVLSDASQTSIVYLARKQGITDPIALKLARPGSLSERALREFQTEAASLARLRHEGIATIHESGVYDNAGEDCPYLAMEFIDGRSLMQWIERSSPPLIIRLDLLIRLCDAVAYMHEHRVLHRHLRPDTIMIDQEHHPRMIDFTMARLSGGNTLANPERVQGVMAWMSPEQLPGANAETDEKTDVHGLGCVAFNVLAGQVPFNVRGMSFAGVIDYVRDHVPPKLSTIDPSYKGELEKIVMKALEKKPRKRFGSAAEMAGRLRKCRTI